jgi:Lipopolysaccharide kinase (Kdo/WaaP) family
VTARVGRWRVRLPGPAGPAEAARWCREVERALASGAFLHRSKHADTHRLCRVDGDVYLKVYRRYRAATILKDLARPSKARHVERVSRRLAAAGFAVPRVLAVGEQRCGPVVRRAWVATAALAGEPVAARVLTLAGSPARKRALLAAVGREVARLHASGFVAGDLVPPNVWITAPAGAERIAFIDHDRTTGGRPAASWRRARRNLVQLNRLVLPAVTVADRLRVYRGYAAGRGWAWAAARRRLPWIVAKTIARRRRVDGVPAAACASFRELMRADGPWAGGARERRAPVAPGGGLPS